MIKSSQRWKTEFQYLKSNQNSHIFLAHYLPFDQKSKTVVILVPPFAEELNRSKRMYVLCARLLAKSGIHAICFDYSGTGDSSGEWGDYSFSDWSHDVKDIYEFACSNISTNVHFIALRFGALVLADAVHQQYVWPNKCVLWDPIEKGDGLTRQLVRMKIAAAMADNSKKISSREVLEDMSQQGYLESAGYHIPKSMFDEISQKNIANHIASMISQSQLHWMNLVRKESEQEWLPKSFTYDDIAGSQNSGDLTMQSVNDVKFWMQQEVTISPKLLSETHKLFTNV